MGNASSRGFAQSRTSCVPPAQPLEVRTNGDGDPLKQYPPSPGGYGPTGVTARWVCTWREYLRAEDEADLTASLRRHEYGQAAWRTLIPAARGAAAGPEPCAQEARAEAEEGETGCVSPDSSS